MNPGLIFTLHRDILLVFCLELLAKLCDFVNKILADRFDLVLVELELDEQVPILALTPGKFVLIQVDNDSEALNLAIHCRFDFC